MQMAHSVFPDSPLGPDAYHEYESLLVQDYEELSKKSGEKPGQIGSLLHNPLDKIADTVQKLAISVHHFPMILCPISPRAFVLPSEGLVAESYLSAKHEDSISPGLPPLSTGLLSDTDDVPPGATLTAHFLYHLAAKVTNDMHSFAEMCALCNNFWSHDFKIFFS
jgi:hypothetical protein